MPSCRHLPLPTGLGSSGGWLPICTLAQCQTPTARGPCRGLCVYREAGEVARSLRRCPSSSRVRFVLRAAPEGPGSPQRKCCLRKAAGAVRRLTCRP